MTMMDIEALNSIAARDVRIMDAVYRTRAALVHRNGMRVQCEGRQQAHSISMRRSTC
ncbi:hypothetical protein [Paraburkholderia phosphatilytica]|uniref:hypothetical protein n=1 Tax=Paraburkholderia phosphatilytica TaxID=2282883 RepID=UPI0013DF5A4F|nr:hypothetical protein [Paraburkholderia phosphatilytica]